MKIELIKNLLMQEESMIEAKTTKLKLTNLAKGFYTH